MGNGSRLLTTDFVAKIRFYPTYQTQYGQNQYQPQYFYTNRTSNNSKALIFVAIGFALVITGFNNLSRSISFARVSHR